MPRSHLVAEIINHYEDLIQHQPVRSINAKNIGNWLCLQRLDSVVIFIAEQVLGFKDDENVGSARKFFHKMLKPFSSKYWKHKMRCF